MSLVFAGICSHAPGITGRIHMADEDDVRTLQGAMKEMRENLEPVSYTHLTLPTLCSV